MLSPIFLVDIFLGGIVVFNAFVIFTYLHPVESPYKKVALKTAHDVVKPVHSAPFLTSAILAVFGIIAVVAGVKAFQTDDRLMLVRAIIAAYTLACTSVFMKLNDNMIKLGIERVLEMEREVEQHDIVTFKPPSLAAFETLLAPMKPFLRVDVTGIERISKGSPHLFVMNHSLYGIEMPFLLHSLYKERGIFARGLADHFHFATPNGVILKQFGAVNGTRANVDVLMQSKQDILVYPGGGHEVLKHSSVPRYQLMWKERLGFARLGIKHGYPIIPCAAVGTEDMLETIMDIPIEFVRKGMSLPVSVASPSKVQKIYFWFGNPIPTKQYNGEFQNDGFAREVRDKAKAAVEAGIRELQEKQKNDPDRYLMDQFSTSLKRAFRKAYNSFCDAFGASEESSEDGPKNIGEDSDSKPKTS